MVVLGMNGIAMARNGLILWENEAAGSRKVFRGFRGLWEAIYNSKMTAKVWKYRNTIFYIIFIYSPISPYSPGLGSAAWAQPY